jgi:dTMP kinase
VLCDRFADSTRAYQGVLGAIEPRLVRRLEEAVVGDTRPDLTVILDVAVHVGLSRALARRQAAGGRPDRFEREDAEFHHKLRQAFLDIARDEPDRCAVVDANRDPEAIEAEIWRIVEARLLPPRAVERPAARAHAG